MRLVTSPLVLSVSRFSLSSLQPMPLISQAVSICLSERPRQHGLSQRFRYFVTTASVKSPTVFQHGLSEYSRWSVTKVQSLSYCPTVPASANDLDSSITVSGNVLAASACCCHFPLFLPSLWSPWCSFPCVVSLALLQGGKLASLSPCFTERLLLSVLNSLSYCCHQCLLLSVFASPGVCFSKCLLLSALASLIACSLSAYFSWC